MPPPNEASSFLFTAIYNLKAAACFIRQLLDGPHHVHYPRQMIPFLYFTKVSSIRTDIWGHLNE